MAEAFDLLGQRFPITAAVPRQILTVFPIEPLLAPTVQTARSYSHRLKRLSKSVNDKVVVSKRNFRSLRRSWYPRYPGCPRCPRLLEPRLGRVPLEDQLGGGPSCQLANPTDY